LKNRRDVFQFPTKRFELKFSFLHNTLKLTGAVPLKAEFLIMCPARNYFPLRESHNFTVFENTVLSRIFDPTTEVAGGWTK
jgi:hypothetical protein